MPGTSSKTKVVAFRVSVEMAERWAKMANALGEPLAVFLTMRIEREDPPAPVLGGSGVNTKAPVLTPKDRLASLKADPKNRIIDPKVHHVSGPVLASAVPEISGATIGHNPKSRPTARKR